MRIVHVSPALAGSPAAFPPAVRELAQAQARLSSGRVQIVAAAPLARNDRAADLELHAYRADWPHWLGRSRALLHHLANCPLEIVHAHCPGQRGLHYAHLAAQRHGAPLVVSPGGALGARARLRGAAQRFLAHPQALAQAAGWHATSAEEADAIRSCGFHQPVCIAPPGIPLPAEIELAHARDWWRHHLPALDHRPVALCLAEPGGRARLHRLVALWGATFTAEWLLLVVGPPDLVDPAEIDACAARAGAARRVLVAPPGATPPHAAANLFLGTGLPDTAFAPVAAALAAGLPALVAADAPWRRLEADNAGWCVPWRDFGPALHRALTLGPAGLAAHGRAARELARREFDWTVAARHLLAFYRNLRA